MLYCFMFLAEAVLLLLEGSWVEESVVSSVGWLVAVLGSAMSYWLWSICWV